MVKVSFVQSVSTTAQIQFCQPIRALFGSGGGAWPACLYVTHNVSDPAGV